MDTSKAKELLEELVGALEEIKIEVRLSPLGEDSESLIVIHRKADAALRRVRQAKEGSKEGGS